MRILHIIPEEKFTNPFIRFIKAHFNESDHAILSYNKSLKTIRNSDEKLSNKTSLSRILFFIYQLNKAEKIILHGLFSSHLILILLIQPFLLKKCFWVIWGGDLYYYNSRSRTFKSNIYEYARKIVIRRLGGFITQVKNDYELVKLWYGVKGKYHYCFMYPSNLYKEYTNEKITTKSSKLIIQLGNSSDKSNNHIEILDKLARYKDKDIEIICPLSYGDKRQANIVKEYGNNLFGKKFVPILDFLKIDEYIELLNKVDVAIFNHERQQALGNITTLLGLGKKVYIREEVSTWAFCQDHKLKVYSLNDSLEKIFEKMDINLSTNNIKNVKKRFSEEKLIEDLNNIFR